MKKHTNKHHHLARRKMSHILDEIYTALLHYGSDVANLRILRQEEGLRLFATSNFLPEHMHHMERMAELLQPAVRSPAMVEEYWELAGEDQYTSDSELALVGQIADEASVQIEGNRVEIDLLVRF